MSEPQPGPDLRTFQVAIVGTGFAGVAMAAQLRRHGEQDFVLLERADEVGGTWRDNTYPGATCDVPSSLYSLSFAPNPDWTHAFSSQPEIEQYLTRVAREHGVYDHVVFGAELTAARWDGVRARWRIETTAGTYLARFLIVGAGALSEPADPDLPGLAAFAGTSFHTARWDHDIDLHGKRVAVIGTGASAVQVVPAIAALVSQLDVYQRSAPWVMPRRNRPYGRLARWLHRRIPLVTKFRRGAAYSVRESYVLFLAKWPSWAAPARRAARRHLSRQVTDPGLRERLRPTYAYGCKRILLSSDYYPALARDHVTLITDPIGGVSPTAITTVTGTERPVDVIIFATGFHVTDAPIAGRILDGDGIALAKRWEATGMQALRGTTVPGYPNLFFIIGPNTGLGHTSMIYMIESQVAYILAALRAAADLGLTTIQPRADVTAAYNVDLQRDLAPSVWNSGGCRSWYLDARGRNTTLWPDFTFRFRRATRRFDLDEYETT